MRRVNLLNIILFVFSISSSIAQNEYDVLKYNPKPTVADQHSYVVNYDYENRILDFPFVREDDILWTKRYLNLILFPFYFNPSLIPCNVTGRNTKMIHHIAIFKIAIIVIINIFAPPKVEMCMFGYNM